MKTTAISLFIAFATVLGYGCSTYENPLEPITFLYDIVDEQNLSADSVPLGSNFVIHFLIINHSNDTIYYRRNHEGNPDFAKVFKATDLIDYGKPFDPLLYPPSTREGFLTILPMSKLQYRFPWKYDQELLNYPSALKIDIQEVGLPYNNDLLEKGRYVIQFEETFSFFYNGSKKSFDSGSKKFRKDFVVY